MRLIGNVHEVKTVVNGVIGSRVIPIGGHAMQVVLKRKVTVTIVVLTGVDVRAPKVNNTTGRINGGAGAERIDSTFLHTVVVVTSDGICVVHREHRRVLIDAGGGTGCAVERVPIEGPGVDGGGRW